MVGSSDCAACGHLADNSGRAACRPAEPLGLARSRWRRCASPSNSWRPDRPAPLIPTASTRRRLGRARNRRRRSIRATGRTDDGAVGDAHALDPGRSSSPMPSSSRVALIPPLAAATARFTSTPPRRWRCLPSCRCGGSAPWSRCCAVSRRSRRLAAFGRAAGLWVALVAVSALVPHAPVFVARDFDIRTANLWESLNAPIRRLQERRRRSAELRAVAAVAPAGGDRKPHPADKRHDQRLRAGHCRLGGPGRLSQGA